MPTVYSKNMLWLKPFVRAAKRFVPVERIMRVHGYRVPKGREAIAFGRKFTFGNRYVITLLAEEWSKSKGKYVRDTYEIVLDTLAHELAHTVHFEHSPDHHHLKYKIGMAFSKVLKKQGIMDHSKLHGRNR